MLHAFSALYTVFLLFSDSNETVAWEPIIDELSHVTSNGEDWLSVEIDGVFYTADSTNVTKEASVYCSSGYFLQDEHDICGMLYNYDVHIC